MRLILAALAALVFLSSPALAQTQTAAPEDSVGESIIRGLFVGPIRYRHEYRDDHDFRDDIDDSDNRDLFKIGFGADVKWEEHLRTRLQLRYTRSWGRNTVNKRLRIDPFGQDQLDIFEAFADLKPVGGVPLAVRVGRQVLAYGDERLVGPLEFVQNPRTFDGVRVLYGAGTDYAVDVWWVRRVQFEGPDDHNHNRPVDTIDFFGLYGSLKLTPDLLLEPYYLAKYDDNRLYRGETGRAGHHLLRHSPGARFVWKLPAGFTWGADAAVQYGEQGHDDIFAWGAATKAVWRAPEEMRPFYEAEVEYIYGSGDSNPRDRDNNTFDNFYPTNHKFYGEIDLVGWQNIHDLELTTRFELFKKKFRDPPKGAGPARWPHERAEAAVVPATLGVILEIGFHQFWLASRKDAWFNAPLNVIRRDPTGNSGRDLGRELDIVLRAGPVNFGYAHFFAGEFIRETTPAAGNASGADYVWAEVALTF